MGQRLLQRFSKDEKSSLVLISAAFLFVATALEGITQCTWITLISFLSIPLMIAFFEPAHVLKYLFLYYLIVSNVLGVFAIETFSFKLTELGLRTHYAGSLPLICIYNAVVLLVLYYVDPQSDRCQKSESGRDADRVLFLLALVGALAVALVLLLLTIGNPFYELGVDRFGYRNYGLPQLLQVKFLDWTMYLVPVIAAGYFLGIKGPLHLFLVVYSVSAFLIGNKFGFFLTLGQLLLLCFYPKYSKFDKRKLRIFFMMVFALSAAALGVVFLYNYLNYGFSFSNNLSYLFQRLAQQGQLWWRTFDLEHGALPHVNEFGDELASYFTFDKPDPSLGTYGIYKVMLNDVSNRKLFYTKVASGSRYALSTPAMMYYYFGMVGMLVFGSLFAWIFASHSNLLVKSADHGNVPETFVLTRFYLLALSVFAQSDFDSLFSFKSLALIAVYVAAAAVRRRTDCAVSFDPLAHDMKDAQNETAGKGLAARRSDSAGLFVAVTPYQLLSATVVAMGDPALRHNSDLIVHNQFRGAEKYVEALKDSDVFRDVVLVDEPERWKRFTGVRVLAEGVFAPNRLIREFEGIVGEVISNRRYEKLFLGAGWTLALAAKLCCAPYGQSYLIDEGSGSHIGSVAKSTVIADKIIDEAKRPLTRRDRMKSIYKTFLCKLNPSCLFNIAGVYLFGPSDSTCAMYTVPVYDCAVTDEVSDALGGVFDSSSFDLYRKADVFYLGLPDTEHFDSVPMEAGPIKMIKESLPDKTIVYRPHPRQRKNVSQLEGIVIDETNANWELLCMLGFVDDTKILVSFGSTACLSPKRMANDEPILVYLYNLMPASPEKGYFATEVEEARSRYIDDDKILVPANQEEFSVILDYLRSR